MNRPVKITSLTHSYSLPLDLYSKKPQDYYYRNIAGIPGMRHILNSFYGLADRDQYLLNIGAVCILNACRINEILSIEWRQVLPSGMAIIKASKGSNSKMIYLGLSPQLVEELYPENNKRLVFRASYSEVYRCLLRFNCYSYEKGHVNRSVTHKGRYQVAEMAAKELGESVASEVLGHRSNASREHYLGRIDLKAERERKSRARRKAAEKEINVKLPDWLIKALVEGV